MLLIILLYLIVALCCLFAGMCALEDKRDMGDSPIFPMSLFWPLALITMAFYLLFRRTEVLKYDHERQREKRDRLKLPKELNPDAPDAIADHEHDWYNDGEVLSCYGCVATKPNTQKF